MAQFSIGQRERMDTIPEREHIPGWIAHLANVGSVHWNGEEEVLILCRVRVSCNCVMLPLGNAAHGSITTGGVKEGEEVLVSYDGHSYYIEHG